MIRRGVDDLWDHCRRGGLIALTALAALTVTFRFALFEPRGQRLGELARPAVVSDIPDGQLGGFDAGWLRGYGAGLTPEARAYYIETQKQYDLVFPFVYGLLLAVAIVLAWSPVRTGRPGVRWLLLVPAGAMAADYAENFAVMYLLSDFPARFSDGLATAAGWATWVKWRLALVGMILPAVGLVIAAGRWLRLRVSG